MKTLMTIICIALGVTAYAQRHTRIFTSSTYELNERVDSKWVEDEESSSPTNIVIKRRDKTMIIDVYAEGMPLYSYTILERKRIGSEEYDMRGLTPAGDYRRLVLSTNDDKRKYLTIMPVTPREEDVLIIFYIN